jgi:hypothetical protein
MAHHTPDGMGADRYNERQNMRAASRDGTPAYTHELAALDADGDELYRTEGFFSEEAAAEAAAELNESIPSRIEENVARFEAVER